MIDARGCSSTKVPLANYFLNFFTLRDFEKPRIPSNLRSRAMSSTPSKAGTPGKSTAPDPAIDDAKAAKLAKTKASEKALRDTLLTAVRVVIVTLSLITSFQIRLFAVERYGRVIHEFDPWFNFRATQYLVDNGWTKFFTWYDHSVWYPLGRPVGTTIYPGMQVTAASIYHVLTAWLGVDVSLNDVCVFLPAGFSILACIFTGGIAYEAGSPGRKWSAFTAACGLMSVLPAHLMRSVAGAFDNECIAVTAMTATFYWWIRSLRTEQSWPVAFVAALSYFYMVAAWGGYTFVLNMVGVHAACQLFANGVRKFSWNLHKAYHVFYFVGTALAIRVPVVGWMPLQSMEQMGPLFVLVIANIYAFVHVQSKKMGEREFSIFKRRMFVYGAAGVCALLFALVQSGKVGPLSARVRGLFVPHTRTGNPLVDSVAEHQATQGDVYFKYFHFNIFTAAVGMVMCVVHKRSPARLFVAAYFFVAMYFSSKMVRLVLLLGPACAAASAVALASLYEWIADEAMTVMEAVDPERKKAANAAAAKEKEGKDSSRAARRAEKKGFGKSSKHFKISDTPAILAKWFRDRPDHRKAIAAIVFAVCFSIGTSFLNRSWMMGKALSEPSIMMRARNRDGSIVMLDDFRESYWWLRDNTPEDSRVMAWWDYGYQINGLGNRTTVADGNTWNHEHIALLGKCLVSPELEGHHIVRHLADYVLVWTTRFAGFHGDDLAKSPHMARIAGSVYKDVHPTDFYIDEMGRPSDYMRQSLLYRLHSYGKAVDVEPLEKYEEVFQSKNAMVRIWKVLDVDEESKEFVKSGANRRCDAGGWYCPGGYPEALKDVLSGKVDYQQ